MKGLRILLDEALTRYAAKTGVSKAAIVRRGVRAWLTPLPPLDSDPITRMIGSDDVAPADVDDVVYG